MKFTRQQIKLAQRLKEAGMPWDPQPGHFVWDGESLIEHDSPFHDRVFFILDLKHFLRRSETIENLIKKCCWLPDWFHARQLLRDRGVTDQEIQHHLEKSRAIESGTELDELYKLLLDPLATGGQDRDG
ncbi:MAG: hypothetical protein AAGA03_04360 [Planctomycetota bacterium]